MRNLRIGSFVAAARGAALRRPVVQAWMLCVLGACAAVPSVSAQHNNLSRQMDAGTVRIDVVAVDTQTNEVIPLAGGSGVVLEGNHIATNAHVASDVETMARELLQMAEQAGDAEVQARIQSFVDRLRTGVLQLAFVTVLGPEKAVRLDLLWRSPEKDLAVLQAEQSLDRPPVTFTSERFMEKGDDVWASGFPGVADLPEQVAEDYVDPTQTRGIISRLVDTQSGWKLYQMDVSINHGNSGGPLFNTCGELVGINTMGAEGTNYAIRGDELMAALDQLGVPYDVVSTRCTITPARDPWMIALLAAAVLLGAVAVVLAVTARGRVVVRKVADSVSRSIRPQPKPEAAAKPVLFVLSGPYRDSVVEVGREPLVIGRDPRVSHLVFPSHVGGVSKRHCRLSYDAARRRFLLEDCWSTNGTFLASGEKVDPDTPRVLEPGDRFYLSGRENLFEVRLEAPS